MINKKWLFSCLTPIILGLGIYDIDAAENMGNQSAENVVDNFMGVVQASAENPEQFQVMPGQETPVQGQQNQAEAPCVASPYQVQTGQTPTDSGQGQVITPDQTFALSAQQSQTPQNLDSGNIAQTPVAPDQIPANAQLQAMPAQVYLNPGQEAAMIPEQNSLSLEQSQTFPVQTPVNYEQVQVPLMQNQTDQLRQGYEQASEQSQVIQDQTAVQQADPMVIGSDLANKAVEKIKESAAREAELVEKVEGLASATVENGKKLDALLASIGNGTDVDRRSVTGSADPLAADGMVADRNVAGERTLVSDRSVDRVVPPAEAIEPPSLSEVAPELQDKAYTEPRIEQSAGSNESITVSTVGNSPGSQEAQSISPTSASETKIESLITPKDVSLETRNEQSVETRKEVPAESSEKGSMVVSQVKLPDFKAASQIENQAQQVQALIDAYVKLSEIAKNLKNESSQMS